MPIQFDCHWQKVALEKGQAPTERSSHGISIISGTLYLFGGEHTARVPIDADVYSIDLSDNKLMSSPPIWRKIEALGNSPIPRIAHAQATIDNKIYIFGGRQGIQMEESPLNDLHYFDVTNETWTEILSEGDNSPSHRSFHQMISVGSSLFIFGGCGDIGRMSDLYEFNTTNSRWTKHSNEFHLEGNESFETISGRGGSSLVASSCGEKLFLLGGFAGKESDDIYIYDLKLKFWKHLNHLKLPIPRSVCVSAKISIVGKGNYVAIFGGEVDPSDKGHEGAGGFANDIILINEESLEISQLSSKMYPNVTFPIQRGWSAGSSLLSNDLKNQFVIFGGLTGDDQNPKRLNDLWICTVD